VLPEVVPVTLDDYRLRHASYKADADLRNAHARYPFMLMWDDHEVQNNYAGDTFQNPNATPEQVREQRAAAYRAYWEHLPVRLPPPDGPDVTLYRSATFGDLARLCLLDERQYADEPPCRDVAVSDSGDCPDRAAGGRQYLGADQEGWLADTIGEGGVAWDLVGNPAVVAGVNAGTAAAPSYYLETWDGYPDARRRFTELLAAASNPLVLTGDYHAGMVSDVHLDPEDRDTPVVATELMTPAITSFPFGLPREPNPQIRHVLEAHGYLTLQVEREQVTAELKVVSRDDPQAGVSLDSRWRVAAGSPSAERLD
jgi:alkaline phosphatase D